MPEIFVNKVKTATGYGLVPAHDSDLEAIKGLPNNQPLRCKVTKMRNVQFHRKIFALLNLLFDWWNPTEENTPAYLKVRGILPEKNFDRFRKDLIILAGHYDATYRVNGDVRVEAKSMAFSSMSEDDAEDLFSKLIDIGIKHIAPQQTEEDMRMLVEQLLAFDGG